MAVNEDQPAGEADRRDEPTGPGQAEFEARQRALDELLGEFDRTLHRSGLALRGRRLEDGALAGARDESETQAQAPHADVHEVVEAMLSELAQRLEAFCSTFARRSEQERESVGTLLRLPERDRIAIAILLSLPEHERGELGIAFRLSERECDALAHLLDPATAEALSQGRPRIAIIDSALELDAAAPSTERRA